MFEKMQSLQKNKTWELTKLPQGKKVIDCKWVYTKKEGFPNEDIRYKERLVKAMLRGKEWTTMRYFL